MHRGEVLFEHHAGWSTPERAHPLASGTKSFCGVMLAAAIEDGLISSFEERVSDTIPEWRSDPRLERMTLRELLSLTGGVEGGPTGRPPSYAESVNAKAFASPGERFRYGPIPFQVFGEVMRRKLDPSGEGVGEYLRRRVLDPIGVRVGAWRTDSQGNPQLPSGASLTARDWARFGEMLRNGGLVQGDGGPTQVIRSDLLAELRQGSRAKPACGVTLWLFDGRSGIDPEVSLREELRRRLRERIGRTAGVVEARPAAPAPSLPSGFMAAGLGKQRMYVFPELEMVVVRQGTLERSSAFTDREFLSRLLGLDEATD